MKLNQSQFALLGLLSLGESSGYDLKQLSEWSVGHFWREGYGQIYPSLKRLAAAGLVKKRTERNTGRPDRIVYTLMAAGRKELQEWLRAQAQPEVPRNELLLKLFFGELTDAETNLDHVRRKQVECESELKELNATKARIEREVGSHPQKQFWLMTLSYGEHTVRARMAWCEETLRTLKKISKSR
jgi:DNA-binding PadR family transcriptional regulator